MMKNQTRKTFKNCLAAHFTQSFPVEHYFFERINGKSPPPFESLNCAYKTDDLTAPKNRELVLSAINTHRNAIKIISPKHENNIFIINSNEKWRNSEEALIGYDAAITNVHGAGFMMSTADCIPLLITDKNNTIAGIAHLGWRNLVNDFISSLVNSIEQNFQLNPSELLVLIGPAIHACCYLHENPIQLNSPFWQNFIQEVSKGRYSINLIAAIKKQIEINGIPPESVHDISICTACQQASFFSCYKEGVTSGRFPSVIKLPGEFHS